MNDEKIISLFLCRNEDAIAKTKEKYGSYCYKIAYNILREKEDAEECESDTYLELWNTIPPQRPNALSAFAGSITRKLSLSRVRAKNAEKRGGGIPALSLDELEECIPAESEIDAEISEKMLVQSLNRFLHSLKASDCNVFLRRYFYCDSIDDICRRYGYSEGNVKMKLFRTREKLREHLEKEGIFI